jgi:predicted phage terminase large subunit-like protein
MACDPSTGTDTTRGDYSAIIIIALDTKTKIKYVIIADIQRRTIDQTMEAMFAYATRFRFTTVGVESNGFQGYVAKKFEEECLKRGIHMPLEYVENVKIDKVQRIQQLQPFIKNGTLQFDKNHKLLMEQMIYFPKTKHDDGPDALEMVFRLSHSTRRRIMTVFHLDTRRIEAFYNE